MVTMWVPLHPPQFFMQVYLFYICLRIYIDLILSNFILVSNDYIAIPCLEISTRRREVIKPGLDSGLDSGFWTGLCVVNNYDVCT